MNKNYGYRRENCPMAKRQISIVWVSAHYKSAKGKGNLFG